MDGSVIQSALVLRDAITRAPTILPPIGKVPMVLCGDEIKARWDLLNTADPDVPSDMYMDLRLAIGDSLAGYFGESAASFAAQPTLPPEGAARVITLSLGGCSAKVALDAISAEVLKQIYDAASPAAFGDLKTMETRVDPLVRSGREIDAAHFSVSPALCDWVERMWTEHFEPKNVRAEPYKINLYAPGDRFAMHRDTPERNLVGTFLLALGGWGTPCDGGGLVVYDTGGSHRWNGTGGWAAFVPYLAHEVEPIASGARATIAFKVFAKDDAAATDPAKPSPETLQEVADLMTLCCNDCGQVGVILSFAYSLHCTALCGSDLSLYRIMQRIGSVESIPVAVHIRAKAKDSDTYYWLADADVYDLSPDKLTLLTSDQKQRQLREDDRPQIPFIPMAEGYEVYSNNRPSVEWAGNYADPANVDTLYVHRALILTLPAGAKSGKVSLYGFNFEKVDLSTRDFTDAYCPDSSFSDALLTGTCFQNADLSYTWFRNAKLQGASLRHANCTESEMTGANLDRADLTGATLCGANLSAAILDGTILTDAVWDYETRWPEGFDPLAHGAQMPIEFAKVRAKAHYPDPEGTITNSLGMKFVPILAGSFVMGTQGDEGEEFPHQVRITKPFLLGMHQVTQAQYAKVTGENPSLFKAPDLPVEHLSWTAAARFCELLSALPDEQRAGRCYRLPTEAEWEYASRAGTTTTFNVGDTLESHQAHFGYYGRATAKHTMPVGSFPPNAWGLFDMHGNVWEWTNDWFSADYYRQSPSDDPMGPDSGTHHTLRGGAASVPAKECRSAIRGEAYVDGPSSDEKNLYAFYGDLGLRVVCILEKDRSARLPHAIFLATNDPKR